MTDIDPRTDDSHLGPTGAVLSELPSPYIPDPRFGLLHLPRFIAKIRYERDTGLPKSYRKNYKRGFDRFLCMHLGVDPDAVETIVRAAESDDAMWAALADLFPKDCEPAKWNRELVQKGMSPMGQKELIKARTPLGAADRDDIRSFADMIDFDEKRIG